jgi:hypothetical protein
MLIDYVEGLRRRGALTLIDILDASFTSGDVFFHWFSLEDEDFVAIFTAAGVSVYDLDGTEYTTVTSGYTYLSTGFDSTKLSSVQVGEYNLIANSTVAPAISSTVDDDGDEYITFHISEGMAWGVRYVIRWDDTIIADYTAPDGSTVDATTTEGITSLYVAASLYTDISTYATPLGWVCILKDNTIIMKRAAADYEATGSASKWTFEDSSGGYNGSCTIAKVQALDDLPPRSWDGHWVRVAGKDTSSLDDFYMTYETDDGTNASEGLWRESSNPTEPGYFDEDTMPHALIRVETGVFYFTPLDGSTYGGSIVDTWASRKAGDENSNPEPAFIGKAIFDMTIIQQRLIMISDDHVNMSTSSREFTFWAQSALADTDTDPIELTTPGERAAHLFTALEHEQNMIVLGDKKQFAVPLRNALTRATAALVPTTAYDVDSLCAPTSAAGGMFFVFSDGVRSGVREYRTGEVETIHVAEEIAAHVGDYLPADIKSLEADRQNSTIVALPYTGSDVYYYQFLEENRSKVISAWSKITLPYIQPLSMTSIDGYFYMIGICAAGIGLYKLEKKSTVYLDLQVEETVVDGEIDLTSWPFIDIASESDLVAVLSSGAYSGLRVQIDSITAGVITLKETAMFNGETVVVGVKYTSTYAPTMPVLRDSEGKAMQLDRLTVNSMDVSVKDTGGFSATLSANYYDDTVQEFSGRMVGSSFVVGETPISTRKERVSVGHDARLATVSFEADDHTDLIIQALEYKGTYTRRGLRL